MKNFRRTPQSLWVMLTVAALAGAMSLVSEPFASADNIFNVSRNFAFIGLIALGQTAVIATGGIDLSVGSVMGLAGIVTGLVLGSGQPLFLAAAAGLSCALACGLVNGVLVGYLRLSPFVVTLGMLSIARSLLTNPRLLLLDEPHEGLAPLVARSVVEAIGNLKSLGVSMLLSEQQLHLVHETADRIYVVDRGRVVFSGTVAEFDRNEEVARRYLMVAG